MGERFPSIPPATIRRYWYAHLKGVVRSPVHSVHPTALTAGEEAELKLALNELTGMCWGTTLWDVRLMVQDFVADPDNDCPGARRYWPNGQMPGYDWVNGFLERNHFSPKNATKLSVPRHNATMQQKIHSSCMDFMIWSMTSLGIAAGPHLER